MLLRASAQPMALTPQSTCVTTRTCPYSPHTTINGATQPPHSEEVARVLRTVTGTWPYRQRAHDNALIACASHDHDTPHHIRPADGDDAPTQSPHGNNDGA